MLIDKVVDVLKNECTLIEFKKATPTSPPVAAWNRFSENRFLSLEKVQSLFLWRKLFSGFLVSKNVVNE